MIKDSLIVQYKNDFLQSEHPHPPKLQLTVVFGLNFILVRLQV